jgi:hypothetical protein
VSDFGSSSWHLAVCIHVWQFVFVFGGLQSVFSSLCLPLAVRVHICQFALAFSCLRLPLAAGFCVPYVASMFYDLYLIPTLCIQ